MRAAVAVSACLAIATGAGAEKGAVIETALGSIQIRFLPDKAPRHVENFLELARSRFYDGTTFHRTIPGYILQGGSPLSRDEDPRNDNFGGPGYTIQAEFSDVPHARGVVSMARNLEEPDSAGSQFFLMLGDAPELDRIRFTVFGRVVGGMEVADRIAAAPRDAANYDRPLAPVRIERIRVVELDAPAAPVPAPAAEAAAPAGEPLDATVRTLPGQANLREGPSLSARVLGQVSRGTELRVLDRRGEWLRVSTGSHEAWIRQDMVERAP